MKKWTMVVSATLLTLAVSTAFASVPQESVYLGGIGYGSKGSYVRQIYSSPTEIVRESASSVSSGSVVKYKYGDSVSLYLADETVYRVEVSANNGWLTPNRVHVGMDASVLRQTYGEPDEIHGDKFIYTEVGTRNMGMVFKIKKDKIDEIEIGKD